MKQTERLAILKCLWNMVSNRTEVQNQLKLTILKSIKSWQGSEEKIAKMEESFLEAHSDDHDLNEQFIKYSDENGNHLTDTIDIMFETGLEIGADLILRMLDSGASLDEVRGIIKSESHSVKEGF